MLITLEIPDRYMAGQRPDEASRHIKLSAALQMFRTGELSAGAAAELAEVDRFVFAEECARQGIALATYSAAELDAELAGLRGSDR